MYALFSAERRPGERIGKGVELGIGLSSSRLKNAIEKTTKTSPTSACW